MIFFILCQIGPAAPEADWPSAQHAGGTCPLTWVFIQGFIWKDYTMVGGKWILSPHGTVSEAERRQYFSGCRVLGLPCALVTQHGQSDTQSTAAISCSVSPGHLSVVSRAEPTRLDSDPAGRGQSVCLYGLSLGSSPPGS